MSLLFVLSLPQEIATSRVIFLVVSTLGYDLLRQEVIPAALLDGIDVRNLFNEAKIKLPEWLR